MNDLPRGWEWATVDQVAEVAGGIQKSPSRRPALNAYPMLRVANVLEGRLDLGTLHKVELFAGELDRLRLVPGDALVVEGNGSVSQVGRAAMWRGEVGTCVHQNHVHRARPLISPLYLLHWLLSPAARTQIERVASSTSGLNVLSGSKLRSLRIPIAPAAEQRRIVAAIEEHLSRLDAAERLLAAADERVALLARSSMRSVFGSLDCPWTTLGEVAEIKGGVTKDSKRQGDAAFVEAPYLRVANVQRGYLDLGEITTIRVHPTKADALRLEPGDVLFNEGGDRDKLGRGWVWEGQIEGCIHQNHVFRARIDPDAFDPYFLSIHGNTWGQAWFEEHGRQTTNLASINLGTLKRFPVPAPPLSEQRAIVSEVRRSQDAHARLRDSLASGRRRAVALRRSILAAAFSGQLVPQNPDDRPASVLLDRIRTERAAATPRKTTRKAKAS